jgi:Na+:H+ antiporter
MSTSLQILLCIAVVIFAAKLSGALTARMGLPLVLGELLAGVVLGPTCLNLWSIRWLTQSATPGGVTVTSVFDVLAQIGVVLLMFVAGLETDIEMMRKAVAPAFWAAVGGVILPMVGACYAALKFGYSWQDSIFIGTILTATSVTITAQTLMNLNQLKSRAGSAILGAAVIDDVLGLIVLSVVIALMPEIGAKGSISWQALLWTLGKMVICLVTMFWLGPPLTRWVLKRAERLHGHHTEVASALIVAFLLAFEAEWFGGMAAITGAYLAGVFVAATSAHQKVAQELHPMINSFFGPIFFVSIGLAVNARHLAGGMVFFVLLVAIALAGKILGCGVGAFFNGFSSRESLIVGVGMIPRGEVGLITASIGLAAGLVSQNVYVQVVVLVLITTLVTPPLLRYAFPSGTPAVAEESAAAAAAGMNGLAAAVDDLADA